MIDLVWAAEDGIRVELVGRLRRAVALRAMVNSGMTQQQIAEALGISQPAVSQQLRNGRTALAQAGPAEVVEAAAPVLKQIAEERGFSELTNSDEALLVTPPAGAAMSDLVGLQEDFASVLGCEVHLVSRRELV